MAGLIVKKKPIFFNPKAQPNNKKIYNLPEWRGKNGLRNLRLTQDPFCCVCGKPAEMVDHINPINNGGDPLDYDNTQSMCNNCHQIKRNKERNLYA